MFRQTVRFLSVTSLLLLPPLLAQEPSLQQVLDHYRDALGGEQAIAAVRTVRIEGETLTPADGDMNATATVSPDQDVSISKAMPFTAWYQLPENRLRLQYMYLGVPGVVSYDGAQGWHIPPVISNRQALPMTGVDLLNIREQADFFGPLINSATKNVQLKLLSPQQMGDRSVQRIEVKRQLMLAPEPTPATGSEPAEQSNAQQQDVHEPIIETSIWKLDSASGLPVEVESEERTEDGSVQKFTVSYSDYRTAGPIIWPHRVVTDAGSGNQQINVLNTVSINIPLDQVQFDYSPSLQ